MPPITQPFAVRNLPEANLLTHFDKSLRSTFGTKPILYNLLKQDGKHTPVKARTHKRQMVINRIGNVGGFYQSVGGASGSQRLIGQTNPEGAADVTMSPNTREIEFGLCGLSAGFTDNHMELLASKAGLEAYGDYRSKMNEQLADEIAWYCERHCFGDGTGALAVVSSVSGNAITLKRSTGTVALAGQTGTEWLRNTETPVVLIDPATGVARTVGGYAGFRSLFTDPATGILTSSRDMSSVATAGDLIVIGTNDHNEYSLVPIGLKGWIDDGTVLGNVFGLSRLDARNGFLKAKRVDLQTSGAALGELIPERLGQSVMDSHRLNPGGKTKYMVLHPFLYSEIQNGTKLDDPSAPVRANIGENDKRRYADGGERMAGNTGDQYFGIAGNLPGYGHIKFLPEMWACQPNTVYWFDPANFELLEMGDGLSEVKSGTGEGGVRSAQHLDVYRDFVMLWNLICEQANRGQGVAVNALQNSAN